MSRSTMAPSGPDNPVVALARERERTIELLSEHFAYDNLSLDELERRIEGVYRAGSVQALRDLTRDLPSAVQALEPRADPVPEVFAPERGRIVSVLAETRRRGVWRPPRQLDVFAIMSDTKLDLTQAQLVSGVTDIHVTGIFAAVKVIVPSGVRVVVQPTAILSSVADEAVDPPPVGSGAPVVRILGSVIFSELKVVTRKRELLDHG